MTTRKVRGRVALLGVAFMLVALIGVALSRQTQPQPAVAAAAMTAPAAVHAPSDGGWAH